MDTYLYVAGPSGQEYSNDDAEEDGSKLTFRVPETGAWEIAATAYEDETGAYEVHQHEPNALASGFVRSSSRGHNDKARG